MAYTLRNIVKSKVGGSYSSLQKARELAIFAAPNSMGTITVWSGSKVVGEVTAYGLTSKKTYFNYATKTRYVLNWDGSLGKSLGKGHPTTYLPSAKEQATPRKKTAKKKSDWTNGLIPGYTGKLI